MTKPLTLFFLPEFALSKLTRILEKGLIFSVETLE